MRVMVLGAGGMLGHDIVVTAPSDVVLVPFTRAQLDIVDAELLAAKVAEVRPEIIINCAAYTAVDKAESEPKAAFPVNATAVGALGEIAARLGARVVHFSTDYVFDGSARRPYREEATPLPINVYGASKLAGELALSRSGSAYLIIRSQWLFGQNGGSFPRTMWERASKCMRTRVVADQLGRTTYTVDLAQITWDLALLGITGLLHAANRDPVTWFEIGQYVFHKAGCPDLIEPCSTAEYPQPARRPSYSVLGTGLLETTLGRDLPPWRDALDRFLSEYAHSRSV